MKPWDHTGEPYLGRNSRIRASIADPMFRAYLMTPEILSLVLPLSSELDSTFDSDHKRG